VKVMFVFMFHLQIILTYEFLRKLVLGEGGGKENLILGHIDPA
jgi:hypothetical protein